MKNLKRVLALVISLAFVMSTVAFAADDATTTSTDTTATEETATTTTATEELTDAENVLTQLNIMVGTDNGFEGSKALTRAEAARLMYSLAVTFGGEASQTATSFTDVASSHWASGYVAGLNGTKVNGKAIINGTSDTTFTPDTNVSYDEFNTMLTIALGYYPYAKEAGGYPAGYKAAAVKAKLYSGEFGEVTYGGSKQITREEVATMMANALVAKPVVKNGYGTSATYDDGTVPYVQDKYDIDVTVGTLNLSNDKYTIAPISEDDVDYVGQYIGTSKKEMVVDTNVDGLESAVKDAMALRATIFSYNKTIKAIGNVGERTSIASTDDVRKYTLGYNTTSGKTEITLGKNKTYEVASSVRVTVNGVEVTSASVAKAATGFAVSSDGDYVYGADHVTVTAYGENKIVDEIALNTWSYGVVDTKYDTSNRVKLVGESKVNNKFYTVTKASDTDENCTLMKDGKTANVSDLAEDDVIKVAVIPANGTKDKDEDLYNLTYATKTITGKATASKRGTKDKDDYTDNHLYYKIGDTYYAVNTYADTTNADNTKSTDNFDLKVSKDLEVGKSGTFLLAGDEIVGFTKGTSTNEEFVGYLSYVGWATGQNSSKLSFSVYVDGTEYSYTTTDELGDGEVCDSIVIKLGEAQNIILDAVNNDTGATTPDGAVDVKVEKTNSHDANKVTNDKKEAAKTVVNEIGDNGDMSDLDPIYRYITLTFDSNKQPDTADMFANAVVASGKSLKYNKNTNALVDEDNSQNRIDLDDDTVIYVQDGDALVQKDASYLVDKTTYKNVAPVIDPEDDNETVIAIVIAGGANSDKNKYAIATEDAQLTSEYKEDGTYAQVTAIVDGTETTLTSKGTNTGRLENIKKGDYFSYKVNATGLCETVNVLANPDAFYTTARDGYADDFTIAAGYDKLSDGSNGLAIVTDVKGTKMTYTTENINSSKYYPTTAQEIVGTNVPVYVYDYDSETVSESTASKMLSSAKCEVTVDDKGTASTLDDTASDAVYNGVFVRRATADDDDYTEGEVIEVVIYQGVPSSK